MKVFYMYKEYQEKFLGKFHNHIVMLLQDAKTIAKVKLRHCETTA